MIFVVLYLESDLSIEIDKFNRKCCLIWFSSVSQPAKFLSQSGIWSGSEGFCPVVLSEKISLRVNCTLLEVLPLNQHTTAVLIKLITAENWKHCRNLDCLSISYWLWRISSLCRVAGGGREALGVGRSQNWTVCHQLLTQPVQLTP